MTPNEILEAGDLIAIGVAGDEVRRQFHGTATTFVRVFEIHVDAPPPALPPRTDAGEFRVVGRPATLDAALASVRAAVALAGGRPVTGFTFDHLQAFGEMSEIAEALGEAGLDAIAHFPIDGVGDRRALLAAVLESGLGIHAITIDELPDDPQARLDLCERARRLQDSAGNFKAFAPLPRTVPAEKPTTGYDDVKQIALARVVVDNVRRIQVDWALYGPKMAQVALTVGADDIDNVSAVDPGILGTRRSPLEEVRTNIKAAALDAVERDGLFRTRS